MYRNYKENEMLVIINKKQKQQIKEAQIFKNIFIPNKRHINKQLK